jgi:hypothetical protein
LRANTLAFVATENRYALFRIMLWTALRTEPSKTRDRRRLLEHREFDHAVFNFAKRITCPVQVYPLA